MPASAGLTAKQEAFAVAYAKGGNASDAYRLAYNAKDMSAAAVNVAASRVKAVAKVALRIAQLQAPALRKAELSVERTLLEVARLSTSDLRRLLDENGSVKAPNEWDDDIAAAVSSIEFDKDTGRVSKVKLWDKNASLATAAKHLGLFEKHNAQKRESLAIQVNLIQSAADAAAGQPRSLDVEATLVEPAKRNGSHP